MEPLPENVAAPAMAAIATPMTISERPRETPEEISTSVPVSVVSSPDSISSSGVSTRFPQELQKSPEPACDRPHEKQERRTTSPDCTVPSAQRGSGQLGKTPTTRGCVMRSPRFNATGLARPDRQAERPASVTKKSQRPSLLHACVTSPP